LKKCDGANILRQRSLDNIETLANELFKWKTSIWQAAALMGGAKSTFQFNIVHLAIHLVTKQRLRTHQS
jgi:hypothetical protein